MNVSANGIHTPATSTPTKSFIAVNPGSNTSIENMEMNSIDTSSIVFSDGNGNWTNGGTYVNAEPVKAITVAPGAQDNALPPGFTAFTYTADLLGVTLHGTLTGIPGATYRIGLFSHGRPVPGIYGPTDVLDNLEITFTVTIPASGTVSFSQSFSGSDFHAPQLFEALDNGGVVGNATRVISQAPGKDAAEVLGRSSEMSAPLVGSRPRFDFDEDRRTDIAVYRTGATPADPSLWYILQSRDNTFRLVQFGSGGDKMVAGDFYGNRETQFAVFRPSNGTWYFSRFGGDPSTDFEQFAFGTSSDIPLGGDFDDDGRNDLAIFRNGTWWIRESLSGNTVVQPFGSASDIPVAADYNGDGRTDVAIYRNGQWWISVCPGCTVRVDTWGLGTDVPVPGDYDGDGKADIAVWRPSDGIWYIVKSTGGFVGYQWGTAGDKPVNGDFDGDGKNDIAVWRPSNGTWYIIKSAGGFLGAQWGQNGDIPVSAFPNAP